MTLTENQQAPSINRQDGPDHAEVLAELARIMASEDFPATQRNRRFLSFVVEQALTKPDARFSAKDIAIAVLGRDESFDPQKDPIIRIEAGKLRRDLEVYYLKSGQNSSVRIELPVGGYRPCFIRREPVSATADFAVPPIAGDLQIDVPAELGRLLSSGDFPASERNRRFLAFVVNCELAGRSEEISAYRVAVDIFGRPETFNSAIDPIVRIEASKLRRDIEVYYLKAGRRHRLRIELPKGGYRPRFTYVD